MSKTSDDDKNNWNELMENFDLLFSRVNDISLIQQDLKNALNTQKEE